MMVLSQQFVPVNTVHITITVDYVGLKSGVLTLIWIFRQTLEIINMLYKTRKISKGYIFTRVQHNLRCQDMCKYGDYGGSKDCYEIPVKMTPMFVACLRDFCRCHIKRNMPLDKYTYVIKA